MLPSHRGRGQHGCGDQPSRQNFKSGHFSFSIGGGSQNILASPLEMSEATAVSTNILFMVVHRARSAEETTTNSDPRSSRAAARERAIGG
jgi:hypothetical protein